MKIDKYTREGIKSDEGHGQWRHEILFKNMQIIKFSSWKLKSWVFPCFLSLYQSLNEVLHSDKIEIVSQKNEFLK